MTFSRLLLLAALCSFTAVPPLLADDACDQYGLSILRQPNGQLRVRWNAAAGTVQLMRSTELGANATWTAVAGAALANDGWWENTVTPVPGTKRFFRLESIIAPVSAPSRVRLAMDGGNFRLEWDSACEAAGYVVYIGLTENTGPGNFLQRLVVPQSNSLLVEGLTAGVRYYITIAHVNHAGIGPAAPVRNAVFGPNGTVSGMLVKSVLQSNGRVFQVAAEDAVFALQRVVVPPTPAWPPLPATADSRGLVSVREVPVGSYRAAWTHNGTPGLLPNPVAVGENGLAFGVYDISPAPSGSTLFGTALLSNGKVPRAELNAYNILLRATVTATITGGPPLTMKPDYRGRWIFQNLTPSQYPVSLKATFAGMDSNTVVLNTPPGNNNPIALTFPQVLPRVVGIHAIQNDRRVFRLLPGPVTLEAIIENPAGLPLLPRWTAEIGDQVLTASGATVTFTIPSPPVPRGGGPVPHRGASASFRVSPAGAVDDAISADLPLEEATAINFGCYSGRVGVWTSPSSSTIGAAHPATVTVTKPGGSPAVVQTTDKFGGYFENSVDPFPSAAGHYLVKIEKPGHMTFLWSFDDQLPNEPQFLTIPADVLQGNMPGSGELVLVHESSGSRVRLAAGSLRRNGTVYNGQVRVEFVQFNTVERHPLPPGPVQIRADFTNTDAWNLQSCAWLRVMDNAGADLEILSNPGVSIDIPPHPTQNAPFRAVWQDAAGYFQNDSQAAVVAGGRYRVPVRRNNALHALSYVDQVNDVNLVADDRTLNYPFDVLVGSGFFPVTITGPGTTSMGRLRLPRNETVRIQILELRQSPGMLFTDPANAVTPVPPFSKHTIFNKSITPSAPHLGDHFEQVSLTNNVVELAGNVSGLAASDFFFSRDHNTKTDSDAYYEKINAPATLTDWLTLNGLPAAFGGSLSAPVFVWDYASAYYYNLGDLGFARAQTMRRRTGPDGNPDIAFAVTNYPSIEEARCGRNPIATVCMDHSLRTDRGEATPSRYTRFYVYGGKNEKLIGGLDFDRSGSKKFVPGSCTICHGGNSYSAGGPTNINARFLPFDLEAYSFHPGTGVNKAALAYMNDAVLDAKITPSIRDLVEGWYGSPSPRFATTVFDKDFVPTAGVRSWAGLTESLTYNTVFKQSCRVCHISRKDTGVQFASYADFSAAQYGFGSVCGSMQMPHAQRSWGVFWGSRAASRLGTAVDQPFFLNSLYNTLTGNSATCP